MNARDRLTAPSPAEAPTRPGGPTARRPAGPAAGPSRGLRAAVGVARLLAGGLVVLAVVVLAAPLALGGSGAGAETVVGHLVAATVAVGATAVAAHPRTPSPIAWGAALLVPVTTLVLLGVVWWS